MRLTEQNMPVNSMQVDWPYNSLVCDLAGGDSDVDAITTVCCTGEKASTTPVAYPWP